MAIVYDRLGINNDESFSLYNQGLLDEWDWIKLDIALIKTVGEINMIQRLLMLIYVPVWRVCR